MTLEHSQAKPDKQPPEIVPVKPDHSQEYRIEGSGYSPEIPYPPVSEPIFPPVHLSPTTSLDAG